MRAALGIDRLQAVYDRVAKRYDFQHAFLTAGSDQRGRQLLLEQAVNPGDSVLDCGAGTGSTGLLAARKTGKAGKVVLFDLSEGMLAVAKQRAGQEQLLDRMEFRSGDMLQLPFADCSFDVVLSTYSMCPVYDPAGAAAEAYRVTKLGGRIGIAHSTDPRTPWVKWIADRIETVTWRVASISLGCRSVEVLPTLERLGCTVIYKKYTGVPLWPFLVFTVEKAITQSSPSACRSG